MKKRHPNPRYAYNGQIRAVMVPSRNGGQTPVCPAGTEICGDAVPGHAPPCCQIIVQGPTPAGAYRRRRALAGA